MSRRSGYDELVILLCTGISQRKMYFDEHPKVVACGDDFVRALRDLLQADGKDSFFLGVVDGKLVHNGRYLVGSSIVGRRLITFADQLRCGGFLFSRALEPRELRDLFTLAADLAEPLRELRPQMRRVSRRTRTFIFAIDLAAIRTATRPPLAAQKAKPRNGRFHARSTALLARLTLSRSFPNSRISESMTR